MGGTVSSGIVTDLATWRSQSMEPSGDAQRPSHAHLRVIQGGREDADKELRQTLDSWAAWMRAQDMADRTITGRVEQIARIARIHELDPRSMSGRQVALALGGPGRGGRRWTPGTRASYHATLKSWFRWLREVEQLREDNPIDRIPAPKVPKRLPRPVSTAELGRMLAARTKARTRMMILLAAYQGLRVHEIAKVHTEDVDLARGTLFVRGKGGVERRLPLHEDVAAAADWMPARGWWFAAHDPNVLFPQGGGHVLRGSVSTIIGNVMTRASVAGTPHCLRHWYATELLAAGVDIRTVQELMGHASLSSTQIYTQVTDARRAEAVTRLPRFGATP